MRSLQEISKGKTLFWEGEGLPKNQKEASLSERIMKLSRGVIPSIKGYLITIERFFGYNKIEYDLD